jgi:hypothetical protein
MAPEVYGTIYIYIYIPSPPRALRIPSPGPPHHLGNPGTPGRPDGLHSPRRALETRMHRRRSHLSRPGIFCNPRCPAITTAREGHHQQRPMWPSGRNQQLSDSSPLRSTAATSPIQRSLPMPYAGMWQAGPTLERRHESATAHSPALKSPRERADRPPHPGKHRCEVLRQLRPPHVCPRPEPQL